MSDPTASKARQMSQVLVTTSANTTNIANLSNNKLNTNGSITSSQVSDFATAVPPLAPIQSLAGGTNVTITQTDKTFTIASTDTDTTYTAGSGLSLNSGQFSINGDQKDVITSIGPSTSAYFTTGTNHHSMFFGGSATGNEKFRFDSAGNFYADADIIGYSSTISDERLKSDVVRVEGALDKLEQLGGYSFKYTHNGRPSAGVLAQEVERILPSAVTPTTLPLQQGGDTEYWTVQYAQLSALFIEAIKELNARVKELETCRCTHQAK